MSVQTQNEDYQVCARCGARNDAFGCYETCTSNGPPHEWVDPPTGDDQHGFSPNNEP